MSRFLASSRLRRGRSIVISLTYLFYIILYFYTHTINLVVQLRSVNFEIKRTLCNIVMLCYQAHYIHCFAIKSECCEAGNLPLPSLPLLQLRAVTSTDVVCQRSDTSTAIACDKQQHRRASAADARHWTIASHGHGTNDTTD